MGLLCKIKGHAWSNGRCRRCGEMHQEHQWEQHDKHVHYCKICGGRMTTSHNWVGCTCSVCGEKREEGHLFKQVSPCEQVCRGCGKRLISHDFQKVDGKCLLICSRCGEQKELTHHFENGVCSECGIDRNKYYMQKAIDARIQQEIWRAAMEITSAECLETVILNCKDHYSKLCCVGYIAKLGDDAALAHIARNKDLDYEIRKKARDNISDEQLRKSIELPTDAAYEAMYNMDIKSGM
ncbi:MAG: hypothetical protein PHY23_11265 [Oscillospiraceae bacterium]|nr:hypothetical protein [Oscillospiraceae bacterium]